MGKFTTGLRRSSPTILTALGIVGVVGTAVTAVRATPKALRLIKAKKDELGTDELTPMELVQTTWRCYVPSALIGVGTVICIIGIGLMDKRNQAALTSAYAMLNESYKQYRQAAKKIYGNDADDKIHAEMAKDAMVADSVWGYQVYNMDMDPESEECLFYDLTSKKYFTTTMAAVLNAQYHANRNTVRQGAPRKARRRPRFLTENSMTGIQTEGGIIVQRERGAGMIMMTLYLKPVEMLSPFSML